MFDENSVLVDFLGASPFIRVVDFLLENIGYDYSKTEIAKGAGIGWSTLYGIWEKLEKYDLVVPTRKYGKTWLYKLSEENVVVKELLSLEMELIENYAPADKKEIISESV